MATTPGSRRQRTNVGKIGGLSRPSSVGSMPRLRTPATPTREAAPLGDADAAAAAPPRHLLPRPPGQRGGSARQSVSAHSGRRARTSSAAAQRPATAETSASTPRRTPPARSPGASAPAASAARSAEETWGDPDVVEAEIPELFRLRGNKAKMARRYREQQMWHNTRAVLVDAIEQRFTSLRKAFRWFDENKNGFITEEEFTDCAHELLGDSAFDREAATVLFRSTVRRGLGYLEYQDMKRLWRTSLPPNLKQDTKKELTVEEQDTNARRLQEICDKIMLKVEQKQKNVKTYRQDQRFLLQSFRVMDESNNGLLSYMEIRKAFGPKMLNLGLLDQEVYDLCLEWDVTGTGYIRYKDFISSLVKSTIDEDDVAVDMRARAIETLEERARNGFPMSMSQLPATGRWNVLKGTVEPSPPPSARTDDSAFPAASPATATPRAPMSAAAIWDDPADADAGAAGADADAARRAPDERNGGAAASRGGASAGSAFRRVLDIPAVAITPQPRRNLLGVALPQKRSATLDAMRDRGTRQLSGINFRATGRTGAGERGGDFMGGLGKGADQGLVGATRRGMVPPPSDSFATTGMAADTKSSFYTDPSTRFATAARRQFDTTDPARARRHEEPQEDRRKWRRAEHARHARMRANATRLQRSIRDDELARMRIETRSVAGKAKSQLWYLRQLQSKEMLASISDKDTVTSGRRAMERKRNADGHWFAHPDM